MPICVYRRTLAAQAVRQEGSARKERRGEERKGEEELGFRHQHCGGSGVESWNSAGHHWKVKMAMESTRVFCGGPA